MDNFGDQIRHCKQVIVIGNYGDGNIGDEAILDILSKKLETLGVKRILVLTRERDSLEQLHNNIVAIRPPDIIKEIRKCDSILFGGGTLFSKYTGKLIYVSLILAIILKLLKKKVLLYNIGFSNSSSSVLKCLCKKVMQIADYISVRDLQSFYNIRIMGVNKVIDVQEDLTYQLNPANEAVVSSICNQEGIDYDKFKVGISFTGTMSENTNGRLLFEMAKLVDRIIEQFNAEVLFFNFCPAFVSKRSDSEFALAIKGLIKNKECFKILRYHPPSITLGLFSRLNLFIGMRFHSLIFAHRQNVPQIVVSYDEKCSTFADKINAPCFEATNFEADKVMQLITNGFDTSKQVVSFD